MMQHQIVFVTRRIPEKGLKMLYKNCAVNLWPGEIPPVTEELLAGVSGAEGILCLLTDRIDGAVMDAAGPGLKVISNYAVGFDNIQYCRSHKTRHRGWQYSGGADRSDGGPYLHAAYGSCPASD